MNLFLLILTLSVSERCRGHQWHTIVHDTPEVELAKAQHFAAHEKAKSQLYQIQRKDSWIPSNSWSLPHYAPQSKYHGPIALPPGYDKHGAPLPVKDTPEVAHVKAVHLAKIVKAGGDIVPDTWSPEEPPHGHSGWTPAVQQYYPTDIKYHGPLAYSPGYDKYGAPLPVLETDDVKHARAAHFVAYHKAAIEAAVQHGHKWKRSIHDTPEVAAAKHAHYAAVEHAKAEIAAATHKQIEIQAENYWAFPHYAPQIKYHGPIALPPGYDKHGAPLPVLDTPEVAHAKAEHLAAVAKAGGHVYPGVIYYNPYVGAQHDDTVSWPYLHYAPQIKYHGPIALPPGYDKHGAPLPVLDTPEVAHAKAVHLATLAKAGGQISPAYPVLHYSPFIAHNHWSLPHYAPHSKYSGPIALPSGYDKYGAPLPVQDTPEVAHAKAQHLAAVAKAGGHIYPAEQIYNLPLTSHEQVQWAVPHYAAHYGKYHGPIALPPGYDKHGSPLPVQDTPEVAAEKAKHYYLYAKTLARHTGQHYHW